MSSPSPPSSSSSSHLSSSLPATFAECPMTHPLNRAPPTSDFPLTLLHFLQHIIRVISVPTSPLCVLTSPLSFHLPFAPKHLSANSTCCAKGNRLFFFSLFLLKNIPLFFFLKLISLFLAHFSLLLPATPFSYLVSYWKQTKRTLADINQLMALHCEVAAGDSSHYSK